MTSELQRLLWSLILGVALLLLTSLFLARVIGGRISRSIHGLSHHALALGSGKAVIVPPLHLKEADEVGQALMKASGMLQDAQYRAHHDTLTGLANRPLFTEIVDHQLLICVRTKTPLALLYVDLDGFKHVNDAYGHATGDELLRLVAMRLKNGIRSSDVTARLGGDEFGIALIRTDAEGAAVVARKLADSVSLAYTIGELTIRLSASIGIAVYPESGTSSDALLREADKAMYKSKAARKV